MTRRVVGLSAGLCALLLVGWGAMSLDPGGSSAGTLAVPEARAPTSAALDWSGSLSMPAPPAWLAGATASDLEPTGIEIINALGVESIVVDGTGAVWVDGAWQLSRVDPVTGSAQTWDASDDAAFATMWGIRPSRGIGVWLIDDDHLRLFDGRRFARDLTVPAEFGGGEGGRVQDVVEVGTEVWVSSAAGVALCSQGGAWSWVGEGTITGAGALTLDSEGYVWSVGQLADEDGTGHAVVRFDGARWTTPGGAEAPLFVEELVADPTGGVVTLFGLSVRSFDGTGWRRSPLLPPPGDGDFLPTFQMGVSPDGRFWAVGPDGLIRLESSGWTTIARGEESSLVGLGFVGADVVVADESGLLRLDGEDLRRVWTTPDPGLGSPIQGLLAVSSDEVWATGVQGVLQFHEGRWRIRHPGPGWQGGWGWMAGWGGLTLATDGVLALATDGVVWAIVDGGLARFEGDRSVVLARDPPPDGWILSGPDAAIWTLRSSWSGWSGWYVPGDPDLPAMSLVTEDGTQTTIHLPGPAWSATSLVAGVDGSVWVTICEADVADYCTVPSLMRWNGQWSLVPYPGAGLRGAVVAPDGALWALLTTGVSANQPPFVARYDDGAWTQFRDVANVQWLAPAPGGGVCGIDTNESALVCLDPAGRASSRELPVPGHVQIGPDGSLWVEDSGVVARLPGTVPG